MRSIGHTAFSIRMLFVLALGAASCAMFASGCGRTDESAGKTVITFWGLGAEGEKVRAMIPEFERLHPEIRVRVQQIPWTAAHEKLLTSYAGNSSPDICQLGNTWVPEFALLEALEDLGVRVETSTIVKKEKYFPGILATNVIDSTLYGIPWYVDTRVLFYRKDLLARVGYPDGPRTWNEMREASKKLIDARLANYGIFLPVSEWAPPVIFGLQNGSTLLKANNTLGNFSAPEFKNAFRFYIGLFHDKLAMPSATDVSNIFQSFNEGYFAMYITGPWNIGEFKTRIPASRQDTWMTAPLPSPDSSYPSLSLAGGASLVMFRSSKHKDAAWKFIEYLSEEQTQLGFYHVTGNLPAVRTAWSDITLSRNQYTQAFFRQFERVVPTPKVPEWEQIAMKMQDYAEAAAKRAMTIDEALAQFDADVDRILEKRRWMMERKAAER
ncbi:MAG TPA: sugar ABC transporter substrate-binding protein [Bacteroidota bacterium]|nr:sugar ABC transporter substrate-binding protein [Bacteroidota bacterium]